jgi:hypothetical protein
VTTEAPTSSDDEVVVTSHPQSRYAHVDLGTNPRRLLWWGALAALAALEVVDWPVAAVVAAGTYIAERQARSARAATGSTTTAH